MSTMKNPRNFGYMAYKLENSAMVKDLATRASQIMPSNFAVDIPPLSQYLWEQTTTQQQDALNSKFIQGMREGTLDPSDFGAYEVQDAVYCYSSKGSIDIAATKVTDPVFKKFLEDQSDLYKKIYEDAFAKWRIRQPDGIDLNDACADYIKLERSVAENMDPLYFVVSLIPCAKLWPWLGQQITSQPHNFGLYASWVAENLNPHDEGYKLLDQIIDHGFTLGLIDKKCALEIYSGCMTGEAQFFSSVTP